MPPFRKRGAGTAFWPWLRGSLLPSPREGVSKEGGHAGPPSLCRRGGVQGNPIERVPLAPLFHRARRILSPGERMGGASCREPAPPVLTEKGKSPARDLAKPSAFADLFRTPRGEKRRTPAKGKYELIPRRERRKNPQFWRYRH